MEEMAVGYEEAAARLSASIAAMTAQLETETDEKEIWWLKYRIDKNRAALTECNKLAEYCRRYYEKGYFIGYGPLYSERNLPRKKKTAYVDTHDYDGERAD